jgi:hypothetical protein
MNRTIVPLSFRKPPPQAMPEGGKATNGWWNMKKKIT